MRDENIIWMDLEEWAKLKAHYWGYVEDPHLKRDGIRHLRMPVDCDTPSGHWIYFIPKEDRLRLRAATVKATNKFIKGALDEYKD